MVEKEGESERIGEFGWCQRLLAAFFLKNLFGIWNLNFFLLLKDMKQNETRRSRPNVETGAEAQRELVEPELFGAPNFGCCWST